MITIITDDSDNNYILRWGNCRTPLANQRSRLAACQRARKLIGWARNVRRTVGWLVERGSDAHSFTRSPVLRGWHNRGIWLAVPWGASWPDWTLGDETTTNTIDLMLSCFLLLYIFFFIVFFSYAGSWRKEMYTCFFLIVWDLFSIVYEF